MEATHALARIQNALERAHQSDALGHCLLFVGAGEQERRRIAERVSRMLLCETQSGRACGACSACTTSLDLHSDYYRCAPAEDARSMSVDDVGALTHFATLSSSHGGYRVATILEAQTLTIQAANALLKLLEEPPSRFVCVLSAHAISRVLPTIRSRASVIRLPAEMIVESRKGESISDAISAVTHAASLEELKSSIDETEHAISLAVKHVLKQEIADSTSDLRWLSDLSRVLDRSSRLARASVSPRLTAEWIAGRVGPIPNTL